MISVLHYYTLMRISAYLFYTLQTSTLLTTNISHSLNNGTDKGLVCCGGTDIPDNICLYIICIDVVKVKVLLGYIGTPNH